MKPKATTYSTVIILLCIKRCYEGMIAFDKNGERIANCSALVDRLYLLIKWTPKKIKQLR